MRDPDWTGSANPDLQFETGRSIRCVHVDGFGRIEFLGKPVDWSRTDKYLYRYAMGRCWTEDFFHLRIGLNTIRPYAAL